MRLSRLHNKCYRSFFSPLVNCNGVIASTTALRTSRSGEMGYIDPGSHEQHGTQGSRGNITLCQSVSSWNSSSDKTSADSQKQFTMCSMDEAVTHAGLTHVDSLGKASMVDVGQKASTSRVAVASGRVLLGYEAFGLVQANLMKKGDVMTVAQLAGIMGAKHTSLLIPLCHNIPLNKVGVDLMLDADSHCISIRGEASTTGSTGVEMEALTAVSIAALTVYDMCKAISKDICITDIRLEAKSGGKNGKYERTKGPS